MSMRLRLISCAPCPEVCGSVSDLPGTTHLACRRGAGRARGAAGPSRPRQLTRVRSGSAQTPCSPSSQGRSGRLREDSGGAGQGEAWGPALFVPPRVCWRVAANHCHTAAVALRSLFAAADSPPRPGRSEAAWPAGAALLPARPARPKRVVCTPPPRNWRCGVPAASPAAPAVPAAPHDTLAPAPSRSTQTTATPSPAVRPTRSSRDT